MEDVWNHLISIKILTIHSILSVLIKHDYIDVGDGIVGGNSDVVDISSPTSVTNIDVTEVGDSIMLKFFIQFG